MTRLGHHVLLAAAMALAVLFGCASRGGAPPAIDLSAVCASVANSLECARAIERVQLAREHRVTRRGGVLRLSTRGGDSILLHDRDVEGEAAIWYSYREYLPVLGVYLVHAQYYEGDGYLMVDDADGVETPIHDLPIRSPDGRRFLTLSEDLFAGYNPNAIQIWASGATGLVLEWSYRPPRGEWGPAEGRWVDDDEIRLRKAVIGENGRRELGGEIVIRRAEKGWNWREVVP
jgi:hypothetical protein